MSVLPTRVWSETEWERIRLGRRAASMDEKWHVFVEGETLHAHRSWTGYQVYEAVFPRTRDGGRRIVAARAEADTERVKAADDERDAVMLELVVSAVVLGEEALELWTRWKALLQRPRRYST